MPWCARDSWTAVPTGWCSPTGAGCWLTGWCGHCWTEVPGQVRTGGVHGAPRAGELRDIELEHVVHALPHFQFHSAAGVFDSVSEPAGVVEQDLIGADLDQQGR